MPFSPASQFSPKKNLRERTPKTSEKNGFLPEVKEGVPVLKPGDS
jgi:hypothetical protein